MQADAIAERTRGRANRLPPTTHQELVNTLGVDADTFVGPEQLPGTVSQPLAERQEVAQPERQDTDESVQLPRSHEELLAHRYECGEQEAAAAPLPDPLLEA